MHPREEAEAKEVAHLGFPNKQVGPQSEEDPGVQKAGTLGEEFKQEGVVWPSESGVHPDKPQLGLYEANKSRQRIYFMQPWWPYLTCVHDRTIFSQQSRLCFLLLL